MRNEWLEKTGQVSTTSQRGVVMTDWSAYEYLRIETTGDHLWTDSVEQAEQVWANGVKVWSEQMNLMFTLRYAF